MACEMRTSRAVLGAAAIEPLAAPGSARSLSKRGVVVSSERALRFVASECGPSPKQVLSSTFENLRRTASTTSSKRMSSRFARTPRTVPSFGPDQGAGSEDWGWRAVGDVASDVVRNILVAAALSKAQ